MSEWYLLGESHCAHARPARATSRFSAMQSGQWHRLFSPMFLHGSLMHLLSNCYSLWRLGPLAEETYGRARLLLIYLLSGVGGNLLSLYFGRR